MVTKKKPYTVQCAIWNWLRNRADKVTFEAKPVNGVFAARLDDSRRWLLIHIKTGYAAGTFPTLRSARQCGIALTKKYTAKAWAFTDSRKARTFKDAQKLIARFQRRV